MPLLETSERLERETRERDKRETRKRQTDRRTYRAIP